MTPNRAFNLLATLRREKESIGLLSKSKSNLHDAVTALVGRDFVANWQTKSVDELYAFAQMRLMQTPQLTPDVADRVKVTFHDESNRQDVDGVITRVVTTTSGRQRFTIAEAKTWDTSMNDLRTNSVFGDKVDLAIVQKAGGLVMEGQFVVGGLLPWIHLELLLSQMREEAKTAYQQEMEEAKRPKFQILQPNHTTDMPQDLIDRLNLAEKIGQPIAIVRGDTFAYYQWLEKDHAMDFSSEWRIKKQGPVTMAGVEKVGRFLGEWSIVAMTNAFARDLITRRAEIAAQRAGDKLQEAIRRRDHTWEEKLRATMGDLLGHAQFRKENVTLLTPNQSVPVEARVHRGTAVHRSLKGGRNNWDVSHSHTGVLLVTGFSDDKSGRLAAARLAAIMDLDACKDVQTVREHADYPILRAVAAAMRATEQNNFIADPLRGPHLDAAAVLGRALPLQPVIDWQAHFYAKAFGTPAAESRSGLARQLDADGYPVNVTIPLTEYDWEAFPEMPRVSALVVRHDGHLRLVQPELTLAITADEEDDTPRLAR